MIYKSFIQFDRSFKKHLGKITLQRRCSLPIMSVTFKAPHRIWLYQPYDPHIYNTGGWLQVETEYGSDAGSIVQSGFTPDSSHVSHMFPDDIAGNMILYLKTSSKTSSIQEIAIRTVNMVDFCRLKWLRFLFTRDDVGRLDKVFDQFVTVKVLDQDLNVLRLWDGSRKACMRERGEINIDGIQKGYVQVGIRAELANAIATLIDIDDNDLMTINDELLQLATNILVDFQYTSDYTYLISNENEYLVTTERNKDHLFLVIGNIIRYSICMFIYNMWVE